MANLRMFSKRMYSERSPYDLRENHIPVYMSAGAVSLYASYQCSEKFKLYNFRRRMPVVALTAGACAVGSYHAWQQYVLRPDRELEYGTWRSCPDCDIYNAFAVAFCINGFAPLVVGALMTTLFPLFGTERQVPRSPGSAAYKVMAKFVLTAKPLRVAFAASVFGMAFAALRINHEKSVYVKMHPEARAPADKAATKPNRFMAIFSRDS